MKRYAIKIRWTQLKRIPKRTFVIWAAFGLFCIYCLTQLFSPSHFEENDLQDCKIKIDKVYLRDSHDTKGTRMKLELIEGDKTFYLWYPDYAYRDYMHAVESDLLTGKVTAVTAKIVAKQSIRERIFNETRIVDLQSDTSVYYELAAEEQNLRINNTGLWPVTILVVTCWLLATLLILLVYRIIVFQKKGSLK